jgi:Fe-S cluster biosynthesis and repair protein YggX
MADVTCTRCKQVREGIPRPPWPGDQGREIAERICKACWTEWLAMQVKVINEYRLNLADPKHAETLEKQMLIFLGFVEAEAGELPEAPYGFGEGGPQGSGETPPGGDQG